MFATALKMFLSYHTGPPACCRQSEPSASSSKLQTARKPTGGGLTHTWRWPSRSLGFAAPDQQFYDLYQSVQSSVVQCREARRIKRVDADGRRLMLQQLREFACLTQCSILEQLARCLAECCIASFPVVLVAAQPESESMSESARYRKRNRGTLLCKLCSHAAAEGKRRRCSLHGDT